MTAKGVVALFLAAADGIESMTLLFSGQQAAC